MSKHEIARTDWARGQHPADRHGRKQAQQLAGERKATGPVSKSIGGGTPTGHSHKGRMA
ncbi:hypothetical protein [Hyphobacterium sp.]|uniref:hypothetical protein n=1 Tax=Hyphobacterium sp. TaxID=2004662 RepID=UPI003BAD46C1